MKCFLQAKVYKSMSPIYYTGKSLVASSKDVYSVSFEILWIVLLVSILVIILMKVIDRPTLIGPT